MASLARRPGRKGDVEAVTTQAYLCKEGTMTLAPDEQTSSVGGHS